MRVANKVRVYRSGDKGIEVEEVDMEAAKKILEEACSQGKCVIDKISGTMVDDVGPDVKELLIVDIVEGG
jgi:(2Fe-2S) ferredoxin